MRKTTHESERSLGARPPVGLAWRKSSYSYSEGACVEVAHADGGRVFFRDSKVQDGPVMEVSRETAAALTAAVDHGAL